MTKHRDDAHPSLPSEARPERPEAKSESRRLHWSPLSFAALGVAALSLILAWYALSESRQFNEEKQRLQTAFETLSQEQQSHVQQLNQLQQQLKSAQTRLQERLTELNTHVNTAMAQRLYQKQDWVLLKARYYLELAQINAHWTDNQATTAALLQQADELLKTLSDQRIYEIRQAIAKEIADVKSSPTLDIAGLMSQLDAAQSLVSKLPIKQSISSPSANTLPAAQQGTPSAWRERLRESLNLLEKLVVVRHQTDDIRPILSPLHQALLRESIRMNLQEAQWALLQNNEQVYQQSLAQALKDIHRTFEKKAPATQSLVNELHALKQTALNPARPVIGQSLPLLNQLIESNTAATPSAAQPASTQEDN
ncbi:hypothetical protein DIZ81_12740 [Legionella taurinensis]|uniref:Heme biosynthesis operon protein HemX n=1 Tax=Legionella taurinensis TaxID=70611 RepID=A0A3A5LHG0_9GAMM|nr:uroporphyrinogen-III C-methyltransferase [Legionella taurinensis]MDX1838712.1 uroporphyrinogen-III C-methyltransferase [Legionella taurinensis]PUT38786.1 hypothetical protein DB744_12485 [Legionella taurinensis]PUT40216.1 hypothetical protein DB746_12150 [Legionella taurinensis]PUT42523.1 hypothetical protein DB743_12635 [Legionella taurinensis]PUT45942.1 hypothetical protein DB745_12545 [Legionella taurinensis]